jgi:hypothetical protein
MGRDRTVVLATQLRRQQCDTPHRRSVPQMEEIAVQMLEDLGAVARRPLRGASANATTSLIVSPWATHSTACTR